MALDINLTEELESEGMARELVNRIQGIRRDIGLEVTDKIHILIENHPAIENAAQGFDDYIKTEVLALDIAFHNKEQMPADPVEINLPGDINVLISVNKA